VLAAKHNEALRQRDYFRSASASCSSSKICARSASTRIDHHRELSLICRSGTQKPPRFPSTACAVALRLREVGHVERCSNVVVPASPLGARRSGALPACRANDPRYLQFVSRDDTIQASVAVLSMKMAQRKRATRIASRPLISVLQPCVLDPSISMTRRREDTDRCRTGRFALIQGVSPNHISKSGPRCHPPVSVSCDQLRKARR
jgi:hypothetical protein